MAVTPDDHDPVLTRAARSLQESSPEARWIDISSSIVSRVRATTRRTWPVEAEFATPATDPRREGDTLRVSDLIVRSAIRRALAGITLGVLEEILGSPRKPLTRDDIDVRVQDIYEHD